MVVPRAKKRPIHIRTQTATGLVNTDEDRVVHGLMERVRAMEAEMASLRWNEKTFEMMECSNEG
jgi:dTDP-4-dehydrorhamnose 3,5-epimerase-like enzyme